MKKLFPIFCFLYSYSLYSQDTVTPRPVNQLINIQEDSLYSFSFDPLKRTLFNDSIEEISFLEINNPLAFQNFTESTELFSIYPVSFSKRKLIPYKINESNTLAFYSLGSASSQEFSIDHIQKINDRLNASITFRKFKSDGFYLNQFNSQSYFNFQFNINTEKRNYFLLPYFIYSEKKVNENGGISNDSLFQTGDFFSSATLDVNLSGAINNYNKLEGGIKQVYINKSAKNSFSIIDKIRYGNYSRNYQDNPLSGYYSLVLLDSTITHDTYFNESYFHEIIFNYKIKNLNTEIFIINDYNHYRQGDIDTLSLINYSGINANYHWKKSKINFHSYYTFTGYNKNNYQVSASYFYRPNKKINDVLININYANISPFIHYQKLNINNYRWNNTFNKITTFSGFILVNSNYGKLKFGFSQIFNYLYLNSSITPQQYNNNINYLLLNYSKEFNLNKFIIKFNCGYQNVMRGDSVYRLPDLIGSADFAFKTHLKALQTKIGLKGYYHSQYYSNAYDPALNSFYLQNYIQTGNYPFLDFYISSSVRTVDFKFTISHFNSGLTGMNYYTTPLYPYNPRAYFISMSWHFID